MATDEVIIELEQKVAFLEATLANLREDNGIRDRIFTENHWGMMERSIQEEHKRLYSLLDAFPGLIYVQEENYKVRYANSNFKAKFGPWEGRKCYEVISGSTTPCHDCLIPRIDRSDTPHRKEVLINNHNYEVYYQPFTDVDGSQLDFKVLIDITDRKNSERDYMRMESLKMVGEMAAGIAHEVRNPLTTVRGFLQLLGAKDSTQQYHDYYQLMIEELDRASFIISDFLSITRDNSDDFELLDLSGLVRSLAPLLSADALNQDKEIRFELEQVPAIHGNKNELRQLLLNIARNGLEAMQGGTILTIQTVSVENYILLRVRDQGGGVDPLILEKLGTPFLTTKEKGTGLGLAICHSIAARHNAQISFESNPNGTTVTVKFAVNS